MTRSIGLLASIMFLIGCSASNPKPGAGAGATRADELREVGGLAGAHSAKGRKVAPTLGELTGYEQSFPLAVKVIRSGEVVVVWGTVPAGEGEVAAGRGGTGLVAYEKKAETAGGWVLLQNGEVKELSASDLATAKAKK